MLNAVVLATRALAGEDGAAGSGMARSQVFEALAERREDSGAEAALAVMALAAEVVLAGTRELTVVVGLSPKAPPSAKARVRAGKAAEEAIGTSVEPSEVASGEGGEARKNEAGFTELSMRTGEGEMAKKLAVATTASGWWLPDVGAVSLASWAVAAWAVAGSESLVPKRTEIDGLTGTVDVARWMDSVKMRASMSEAGILTCLATTIGSDAL